MGWQKRNGRWFFYRSKRVDGRVITEYIGAGERAQEIIAKQEEKTAKKQAIDAANDEAAARSQHLAELDAVSDSLTSAELVREGFHQRRRMPWARRTEK